MHKLIAVITFVILFVSCNTTGNRTDYYEGFEGNKLTVFISEFIPEEKNTDSLLYPILTEKLSQRAFVILASYVSINLNKSKASSANDQLLNNTINLILSQGRIVRYSFNENSYCEAFAEYEVSGFYKIINEINNQ